MRLIIKTQHAMAAFYRAEDSGDLFAMCCRRGAEQALGRRMRAGEAVEVDVSVREIGPAYRGPSECERNWQASVTDDSPST